MPTSAALEKARHMLTPAWPALTAEEIAEAIDLARLEAWETAAKVAFAEADRLDKFSHAGAACVRVGDGIRALVKKQEEDSRK